MPSQLSYPGVYIEEIPSGVRTIVGVPTSVAAFVGRALYGPVDEPVMVNSFGDFASSFGGMWEGSYLGYAVRDFFLNGGGQALVVRVSQNATARRFTVAIGDQQVQLEAASPGAWSKTLNATSVPSLLSDSEKIALGLDPADKVYNVTLTYLDPRDANRVLAAEAYRNVVIGKSDSPFDLAAVLKSQSSLARVAADGAAPVDLGVDTTPVKTQVTALSDALKADALKLPKPSDPIDWAAISGALDGVKTSANALKGALDTAGTAFGGVVVAQLTALKDDEKLKDRITAVLAPPVTDLELVEVNDELGKENTTQSATLAKARSALPAQTAAAAASTAAATAVTSATDAITVLGDAGQSDTKKKSMRLKAIDDAEAALALAARLVPDADQDGTDGDPLVKASFLGDTPGVYEADRRGLYALNKSDIFNLLCIPPYKADGNIDADLIDAAAVLCKQRRAFLIIDPPAEWSTVAQVKAGVDSQIGSPTEYAAVFFPRLVQRDPLRQDQWGVFAPCGAVAGVMARTDTQRGVWKAPAGQEATLFGVPQLSMTLNDAQNGELNPLGVNCLRVFPASGRVVWGARTRRGNDRLASEWKYIPIRRLANYIEESLYRGTQWVVFEPNDEPLWAQIRLNVGAFMHDLFRQGAFQGRTPREAYFVKCDRETNPQSDINKGIVNVIVGFAPLKPAEFVVIKLQQMTGDLAV